MRSLKPLARISNAWHGLIRGPRDAFKDQRSLLSEIKVKTIFDIGANIGDTVNRYTNLFPEATIYGFKPFPDSFEQLRKRFRGYDLVKAIQAAVSNRSGTGEFYAYRDSAVNSLLPAVNEAVNWVDTPSAIGPLKTIDVPLVTMDEFCERESIDRIDVLKMDIQGGELMALEGAREKLAKAAISLIYTEMLFVPIYSGQASFDKVCSYLSDYDYRLFDMYDFAYARNGQLKWCDAIFVSPLITF